MSRTNTKQMVIRMSDDQHERIKKKVAAYALVNSGQIRCVHIGKNIRIPQSALMDFLNNYS